VESLELGMGEVVDLMELCMAEYGAGRTAMPVSAAFSPGGDTFFHAMPAAVPAANAAGAKWFGSAPSNTRRGLPTTTGVFVLNAPESGVPLAIMDAAWLTMMRSSAISAVGARRLARPESAVLAIVGAGAQGRGHLLALSHVLPRLREVRVYDAREEATTRYCREMGPLFHGAIEPVSSPRQAIEGADVVVTATATVREPKPFVQDEWVKPGCFAIPMEMDCAWGETLWRLDRVLVDDRRQLTRIAAGEFAIHSFKRGLPPIAGELGDVVAGRVPARQNKQERIALVSAGMGIEDVVVGRRLFELAVYRGVGQRLRLM
jgi:ornithine cyclodeaminase/alanine dehydrogenase